MNSKYISMFLFVFVTSMNALTTVEKLEAAKKQFLLCEKQRKAQSAWSRTVNGCMSCETQEKEFRTEKKEIDNLLWGIKAAGQKARLELSRCDQSRFKNMPWIGCNTEKNIKNLQEIIEMGHISNEILKRPYKYFGSRYDDNTDESFEVQLDQWIEAESFDMSKESAERLKKEIMHHEEKQVAHTE